MEGLSSDGWGTENRDSGGRHSSLSSLLFSFLPLPLLPTTLQLICQQSEREPSQTERGTGQYLKRAVVSLGRQSEVEGQAHTVPAHT